MDRNGDKWTGDEVDAEARGESGTSGRSNDQDIGRDSIQDEAARQRSIDSAAEESVHLNDDGDVPATTAGSGAAGESD